MSIDHLDVQDEILHARWNAALHFLTPGQKRLLSAVHEAGHAVVAHTLGFPVVGARVNSADRIGLGGDEIVLDLRVFGDQEIPLPDLMSVWAAGFQASCMWMQGRGVDFNDPPVKTALNTLAGGDHRKCEEICRTAGAPELGIGDGLYGAAVALSRRWYTAMRLAYALAAAGALTEAQLAGRLSADPDQRSDARSTYQAWVRREPKWWLGRAGDRPCP